MISSRQQSMGRILPALHCTMVCTFTCRKFHLSWKPRLKYLPRPSGKKVVAPLVSQTWAHPEWVASFCHHKTHFFCFAFATFLSCMQNLLCSKKKPFQEKEAEARIIIQLTYVYIDSKLFKETNCFAWNFLSVQAVGDVVQTLAAAIFLDADLDIETVWKVKCFFLFKKCVYVASMCFVF